MKLLFHKHKFEEVQRTNVRCTITSLDSEPFKKDGILVLHKCKCGKEIAEAVFCSHREKVEVEYAKNVFK